ncbi:MAG TPA: response regulator [Bacillota bacterium]|nr:response regulator [Bacillota bacterium]
MIRVMIVDDEILVRVGLKTVIDWQKYGFAVVAEAGNGRDALEKLKNGNIDIVLLDIKMPIMDGIELLHIIRVEKLPVKVIILSCHDDFDYVKECMKLGASDYLLKLSLDTEKLINILEGLKIECGIRPSQQDENLDNPLPNCFLPLLERFDADVWLAAKRSGIRLRDEKIVVFYMSIDDFKEQICSGIVKNPELSGKYVVNTITDIITSYANGDCFEKLPGEYISVINPRTPGIETVENIAKHIRDSLKQYYQFSVSVGISPMIEKIEQIEAAYQYAKKAWEMKFFKGKGNICVYSKGQFNAALEKQNKVLFTVDMEEQLKHGLEYIDLQFTLSVVNGFFGKIVSNPQLSKEVVINNLDDIMMLFAKELRSYDKRLDDILQIDDGDLKNYLRSFDYLEDLRWWMQSFIKYYFDFLSDINTGFKRRKEILQAIQYIEENYTREISLAEIAKQVNLSESYFSYLFKKETGDGLANYISHLRLTMGKKLLKNTTLSICEIAEKIGFNNVYYFSGTFKKVFGVSPKEYQKMVNRKKS